MCAVAQWCVNHVYSHTMAFLPPLLCSALQGKLAMAYGDLIHQMWMQDAGRAMAPRNFKRVIGKFKAAFSGYVDEELL